MRHATLLIVLVLCSALVSANQNKSKSMITNLLSLKVKATDAVDSGLAVLQDLKQANIDSQTAADQLDATQQAECAENVIHLQEVVDQNRKVAEEATAHREFIDQEIADTNDYLNWIQNRVKSIHDKREQLEEQRCVSNAFFIRALKEHSEAIDVIELLKKDLAPYTTEGETGFTQVRSVSDKLKAYSHLFNTQAIKAFNQLSQVPEAQEVDSEHFAWNSDADDNNQGELQLEGAADGSGERNTKVNLGDRLVDLLDKLKEHLQQSIADLTKNEIQSAWDLATWLHHSEQELEHLENEAARKTAYLEKLTIAHQSAKAHEDQSWSIHDSSVSILKQYVAECEAKHNWYLSETARRNSENGILDEVIQIFLEKVSTLGSDLRDRADDYVDNQQFDNSNKHKENDLGIWKDIDEGQGTQQ